MPEPTATDSTERLPPEEQGGLPLDRVGILVVIGALLWGAGYMLSSIEPAAAGLAVWKEFLRLILRNTLQGAGVLALAAALAVCIHRPVGRVLRRFWTLDRRAYVAAMCILGAATSIGLNVALAHTPFVQDEIAMLFQAKNFAQGHLYAPAPPKDLAEFFDYEFIVRDGPRWYGKYGLGPSLLLVPGVWLGVPWLANPLLGGLAVLLVYALARELVNDRVARVAALLAAISPFRAGVFALMMSHGGCLCLAMLFTLYAVRAARNPTRYRNFLWAGLALGAMIQFRPYTSLWLGIAVVGGAAVLCRWRELRASAVWSFALPVAASVLLYMGYNHALTGDATLSPFERWSKTDKPGFGPDVGLEYWPRQDRGHTPVNGLVNTYINLDDTAQYLLGWGRMTLVLLAAALLLRLHRGMFVFAALGMLSLIVGYFFYNYSGQIHGLARYWSEAMGFMFVLAAGGLAACRKALARAFAWAGWMPYGAPARAAVCLAALTLTLGFTVRAYSNLASAFRSDFRFDPQLKQTLERQPLTNAIVFVPSHWYRESLMLTVEGYGAGVVLNEPDLERSTVIFARDRGDQRNAILMRYYPDRKAYRYVNRKDGSPPRFEPLLPPATSDAR